MLPFHREMLRKVVALLLCAFSTYSVAMQYSSNLTKLSMHDNSTSQDCDVFIIDKKLEGSDIGFTVIAAVCIVTGFFLIFAGYRYLRVSLFIEGITVIAFITYVVLAFYTGLPFAGILGVSFFVGTVFAVISVLITIFGLFISGFTMGFFLSVALILAISPLFEFPSMWIPFGVSLGFGLTCAVLSLKFQKILGISSTSMFGGVSISLAVDYYIEEFLLLDYVWKRMIAGDEGESCWFSWIVLALWPLFFVVGCAIQFRLTARYVDHSGKDKMSENFYGSEKAIKRYHNMNKSGDVVTTSWLRERRRDPEDGQDRLIEDETNV